MECPLSIELQLELGIVLGTVDNTNWHYSGMTRANDYTYTLFLMFTLNRRKQLIGEFQYLGYTATRCGLPHILNVMAQMGYPPAISYMRKQIIDEVLADLDS